MKSDFNSHDFIEKFSHRFESDYIEMLEKYKTNGSSFQTVHRMIAKFLSENKDVFCIENNGKVPSENVYGNIDYIESWKKI